MSPLIFQELKMKRIYKNVFDYFGCLKFLIFFYFLILFLAIVLFSYVMVDPGKKIGIFSELNLFGSTGAVFAILLHPNG